MFFGNGFHSQLHMTPGGTLAEKLIVAAFKLFNGELRRPCGILMQERRLEFRLIVCYSDPDAQCACIPLGRSVQLRADRAGSVCQRRFGFARMLPPQRKASLRHGGHGRIGGNARWFDGKGD
jgi:hypothetical protein